jgi:penicillin-binding protein 1A
LLVLLTSVGLFGSLPSFRDLENPKSNLASEIISSDKKILGKYYVENRSRVNFNQIDSDAINALIATEDNHFYSHSGIDFWRTFSIIGYNLIGRKQGASTITQQLALNLFSGEERARNPIARFSQKLRELITAVKIERHYTKQEIITMYLNTVDFSQNTAGIESAAQTFFNTSAAKLTPDQAALLIGQLKAPSQYSPIRHPDRAETRRNFILGRMASQGYLNDAQAKEFQQKPLTLDYHPINHYAGPAPYFRAELRKELVKLLSSEGFQTKPDGTPYDLDRDGLKIYTTINYSMQTYAEEAQHKYMRTLQNLFNSTIRGYSFWKNIPDYKIVIETAIKRSDRYRELRAQGLPEDEIKKNFYTKDTLEMFTWKGDTTMVMSPADSVAYCQLLLRNSLMSMDPTTGYVKAWVGGINYQHFQFDQVKVGKRQVGSTAKPFTYAVAIEGGYSPCLEVPNVPDTIYTDGKAWAPGSARSSTIPGLVTLRKALANSQNWITAHVMKEVGPVAVMEQIKKMGITSDVPPYPSIALGTFDASVMDMTGAYSAFVNHGVWTQPTYLLRIEDKNGNVIYDGQQPKVVQALTENTAYVMTSMLKSVVQEGTGRRLGGRYGFSNPIGGKTGTTNDNSDGWFMGITPQLVTGVWTGFESRLVHFRSTDFGEGANTALPIFAEYMKAVYADPELGIKKNIDFEKPKQPLTTELDCSVYSQQKRGTNEVEKKLSF